MLSHTLYHVIFNPAGFSAFLLACSLHWC